MNEGKKNDTMSEIPQENPSSKSKLRELFFGAFGNTTLVVEVKKSEDKSLEAKNNAEKPVECPAQENDKKTPENTISKENKDGHSIEPSPKEGKDAFPAEALPKLPINKPPVYISLLEILVHSWRKNEKDIIAWFQTSPANLKYAFDYPANSEARVIVINNHKQVPENLWFIGDIHGDSLALESIVTKIDKETPDATIVFLGDIIDRHPHSYECIIYLLELIKDRPGKILWLAGNHDVGLSHNGTKFVSGCEPSEFTGYLNSKPELKDFGIALCNLLKRLPRALFLPDGLLCTHGGVPHEDLQESLKSENDLNSERALTDFTWTRIHSNAPRKIVNRMTTGCELGYENVKAFCDKASEILQIPVKRLICGHQHPCKGKKGVELLKNPEVSVLVLNSSFYPEEIPGMAPEWIIPYIARYRKDELPEEVPVALADDMINAVYRSPEIPLPEQKTSEPATVPVKDEKPSFPCPETTPIKPESDK